MVGTTENIKEANEEIREVIISSPVSSWCLLLYVPVSLVNTRKTEDMKFTLCVSVYHVLPTHVGMAVTPYVSLFLLFI